MQTRQPRLLQTCKITASFTNLLYIVFSLLPQNQSCGSGSDEDLTQICQTVRDSWWCGKMDSNTRSLQSTWRCKLTTDMLVNYNSWKRNFSVCIYFMKKTTNPLQVVFTIEISFLIVKDSDMLSTVFAAAKIKKRKIVNRDNQTHRLWQCHHTAH